MPRDWSQPAGPKYSLYLARRPATDRAHRIGSAFFNFGGPGEAGGSDFGSYLRSSFDSSADALNRRFDLVSWDPRGTGRSAGVKCTTPAEARQPDPDPTPDTPQESAALRDHVVRTTDNCLQRAGSDLSYIDTWSSVRDLDALRQAVGDRQLSYVGYSYGTELGMEYLATYPTRVRAMVLDGVDLPQDPITADHDQAKGFEQALDDFLSKCQHDRSSCSFGDGEPRQALAGMLDRLRHGTRIPAEGNCSAAPGLPARQGTVGTGEALDAMAQALYDQQLWPILSDGLAEASRSSHPDASCLLGLRDYFEGFVPGGSFAHLMDAFTAISCADQSERSQDPLGDHPELVAAWSHELPFFGGQFASQLPGCWHYPPARHPLTSFTAAQFAHAPPVVLVGNTGDPATPYAHAEAANRLIPGSVLVTWESTEHTVYLSRDSRCVDQPLTRYLVDRKLPSPGLRCKP